MRFVRFLSACGIVASTAVGAHAQAIDWAKIDGIFGRTGPMTNCRPCLHLRISAKSVLNF